MTSKFVEIIFKTYEAVHHNYPSDKIYGMVYITDLQDKKPVIAGYSRIYDKFFQDTFSQKSLRNFSLSRRYPSDYELRLIGPDNFYYLQHFYDIGILTNEDLELILNKINIYPQGEVNKNTINFLIFSLVLDIDSSLLPGSILLLFSSDKIN